MSLETATASRTGNDVDGDAKAILYLRVSSKRQMDTAVDIDPDGNSIATQREVSTRKANSLAAIVVQEFVEPGVSAATIEKRQVFQDMVAFLRENPDIRYVIVYARSRAFRNYIDAAITKRLLDKLNVKLVSAREDFGDGVYADMMEAVTDIFNDVQNRLSGEDIRIKLQHKAVNGGTIGRARVGYLNTRIEIEGRMVNTVSLDPERATLVRNAFELYATGEYSIDRLTAAMADIGLKSRPSPRWPQVRPVSDTTLHRMLRDPYYAGFVVYKGAIYPGRHEAIVSHDVFDRVQDILNFRSDAGQRDRILTHYLKGVLFCQRCHEAGRTARLIYTEATGKTKKRYGYFLCRARQEGLCDLPHLRAELVEEAVVGHYVTLRLPDSFRQEVREQLEEAVADDQTSTHELHAALTRRLKELDERESRLIDLAADDALPQAKIRAKLHEIQRERERARTGLTNTSEELAVGTAVLRDALHLVNDPQKLYRNVADDVRRHLNQTFYERFYIDDLEVADDEKTPLFAEMHQAATEYRQPARTTDQQESPRQAEAFLSTSTDLLTLSDLLSVKVSSKAVMVGRVGLEPTTNGL
jgi:site-specific DNA recombinase